METSPYSVIPPDIVFDPVHLKNTFCYFIQLYTNGSQDDNDVASATVFPSEIIARRLFDSASIFTAEAQALAKHSIVHLHIGTYITHTDTPLHT